MPSRFGIGRYARIALETEPGDEQVGAYTRQQLQQMDANFCAAVEHAIARGDERRQSSRGQPLGNVPSHTLAARRTAQRYLARVDELRGD
jgi:hypothetical protein